MNFKKGNKVMRIYGGGNKMNIGDIGTVVEQKGGFLYLKEFEYSQDSIKFIKVPNNFLGFKKKTIEKLLNLEREELLQLIIKLICSNKKGK